MVTKMKHLEEYIRYLTYEKHYSSYTVVNYESDILEFIDYLDKEQIELLEIDYTLIRNYLGYLFDKKKDNNTTVSRKISSLRGFYKYLSNHEYIKSNPFRLVSLPKKAKTLPKYFYYNELEELFNSCDTKTPLGQRDELILELLYATGVRVSELVNIKLKDINEFDLTIKILGKGNKERLVSFGEYAKDALDLYKGDGRCKLNVKNSDYLFLNHIGGVLTTRGVRDILDRIIKRTTIDKNISPHMLRHTFATHLINEGCDLLAVSELLGHESLAATQIYTHVTTDHLKEVYFHAHPRAYIKDNKGDKNEK